MAHPPENRFFGGDRLAKGAHRRNLELGAGPVRPAHLTSVHDNS
ncbi:MAG: hypothetical protein OJF60_000048 [Burkholderiaceae bacterium]|nr:MAG: hypothetical protein OJF60_000048 [Burkholderiaceae bacterium]